MCVEYGYTRKSTPKQSIERQIRNIKADYPKAVIIQETYTGTKMDRKEWNKLYNGVKPGDTIILIVFPECPEMLTRVLKPMKVFSTGE